MGVGVVGGSGVLGCAPPFPALLCRQRLRRSLWVYQGVLLPVHVCFACACLCVRLGAYAGSCWITMCKRHLYVSVRSKGFVGRHLQTPRRAL